MNAFIYAIAKFGDIGFAVVVAVLALGIIWLGTHELNL